MLTGTCCHARLSWVLGIQTWVLTLAQQAPPLPPTSSVSPALGVNLKPLPLFLLPLLSSISHLLFTPLGTSTLAPFSCHAYTFNLINGLSCQDSSWALGSVKFRTWAVHAPMVGLEQRAGQVPVGKDLWLSSLPATLRAFSELAHLLPVGTMVTRGLPGHSPPSERLELLPFSLTRRPLSW